MTTSFDLNTLLECPDCRSALSLFKPGELLKCTNGHSFSIVDGIPVLSKVATGTLSPRSSQIEVSVLILALNEEDNIGLVLRELTEVLSSLSLAFEVVIVDGGSSDNTVAIAESAGCRVIRQTRPGYAQAFVEGLSNVQGEFVLTLDGDCSHPAALIPDLLNARSTADIIIASRYIPNGSFSGPKIRQQLSQMLNRIFKFTLSLPIEDLSSGYRLYRRAILTPASYVAKDFSILPEVVVRAICDGYVVKEVPLNYLPRRHGRSHVQLAKFAASYIRTLGALWRIRNDANSSDYDSRAFDSKIFVQRWWQRARYRNIAALLGRYQTEGIVLDIGCGSSRIIQGLPHCVAFDLSMRKLRFLARSNPHRVCGSSLSLPFQSATFDCVIHSQLIEHLPMDDKIFSELRRVIKPGGTLILGTVDYESLLWPTIERIYGFLVPQGYAEEHISHYSLRSLKDKVASFGFVTEEVRTILGAEITLRAIARN